MKIFYYAYTNKGNLGDLLITKYQIEEYAKYGEVYVDCHGMPVDFCRVIFDTTSPNIKNFEHEYGLCYRSINIFKVIRIMNSQGFTHFCDSPGPRVPLRWPLYRVFLKLVRLSIPNLFLNKKIKRFSLGVDLFFNQNDIFTRLNKWNFNQNDVIGIRSKPNFEALQSVFDNVSYVPDMAFLYPNYEPSFYESKRNRIALSFKKVEDYDKLVKAIQTIKKNADNLGLDIDILYQVDEDENFCRQLYRDFNGHNIHFIDKSVDFYSLDVYKKYDIVYSNRLHVLLMGAMNGAIPYGLISHDWLENKIKDIFHSVFRSQFTTYIEEFDENINLSLYNNQDDIKKEVRICVGEQRELCLSTIEDLFNSQYNH